MSESTVSSVTLDDLLAHKKGVMEAIDVANKLARLQQNPDFKAVVLDLWMVKECARYAQQAENPALQPEAQQDCARMAAAPGHFKRWMEVVSQISQVAKNSLDELDNEIDSMRAEGAE